MKIYNRSTWLPCLLSVSTLFISGSVSSAPGVLSDKPLSLVTATKPNILLLLDDSGSMNYTNVITDGAIEEHKNDHAPTVDGSPLIQTQRSTVETINQLYQLCAGYNSLAFNPRVKYEPWKNYGDTTFPEDQSGSMTAVVSNPLEPSITADISKDIYILWNDTDNDGEYDDTECGPGLGAYDTASDGVVAMPASGTLEKNGASGVFTDSDPNGNYNADDSGIFVIDIPVDTTAPDYNADNDFITFTVNIFNVDLGGNDGNPRDYSDSLTIYAGTKASPVANGITLNAGGYNHGTLPKVIPSGVHVMDGTHNYKPSNPNPWTHMLTEFKVSGHKATFEFDGGDDIYTRSGFSIAWQHSSVTVAPDGIVTEDDCGAVSKLNCIKVSALPDTQATDADIDAGLLYNTKQNYANWYTYYRNRDYVAKKALAEVVYESEYRLGFATINDNGNGGALIQDMEDNSDGSINPAKSSLLEQIYLSRSQANSKPTAGNSEGTPLILALDNAGRYFKEGEDPDDDFFGTSATPVGDADSASSYAKVAPNGHADAQEAQDGVTVAQSPVFEDSSGGQCQQNFTLMFTDGAWTDNVSANIGDYYDRTGDSSTFMGNVDNSHPDYGGGAYSDIYSDTLADVAMYYFANDLAPSASDSLSVGLHGDSISHQHMVVFGVGFGVNGTVPNDPSSYTDPFSWPNPGISNAEKIDDLRHAAFNSRGGYFSASNSEVLQQELDAIITEIGVRVDNTAAGASFNSVEILGEEGIRYDVTYNTSTWWGELEAYSFNSDNFDGERSWSADEQMTALGDDRSDDRQIITYNGTKGIPFTFSFPSDYRDAGPDTNKDVLSAIQVADLLRYAPHRTADSIPNPAGDSAADDLARNQAYGEALVEYLRGNPALDGASLNTTTATATISGAAVSASFNEADDSSDLHVFRDRDEHFLGALIHSQPLFVGEPNNNYPDDIQSNADADSYLAFANDDDYKNRRSMVYVGGNDGMLHGFYAEHTSDLVQDGGKEVFAYIPKIISDPDANGLGLSEYAQDDFTSLPYVDGSPVVGDVFVDRSRSDPDANQFTLSFREAQWRSYLVGGLRAGGKGIYVLDVTNPDNNTLAAPRLTDAENQADKIIVNEFTHPKLGHVFGKPKIGRMNNGRWAAIVGNGYNSAVDGSGTASLFIIYLDAPRGNDPTNGIYNDTVFGGDVQLDYSIITASSQTWNKCADEDGECTLTEPSLVRYGVEGNYVYENRPAGTFTCDNATFGDPAVGVVKDCDYSDSNGLSQPAVVDDDGNGTIDRVYAGDLHGNMWVFDVSAEGAAVGAQSYTDGASEWGLHNDGDKPFFTACGSTGEGDSLASVDLNSYGACPAASRQAITSVPLIRKNPIRNDSTTSPNYLVFFGTGQYLVNDDKNAADTRSQAFYAIWDAGSSSNSLTTSNLQRQVIENGVDDLTRTIAASDVGYSVADGEFGWYMHLPGITNQTNKERIVLTPLLIGRNIIFATLIPVQGACNASAGNSFLMIADALTGGAPSISPFGTADDNSNIAGLRNSSVIIGLSQIKTESGNKIVTTNADSTNREISASISNIGNGTTHGNLFGNSGRKSWSILR